MKCYQLSITSHSHTWSVSDMKKGSEQVHENRRREMKSKLFARVVKRREDMKHAHRKDGKISNIYKKAGANFKGAHEKD